MNWRQGAFNSAILILEKALSLLSGLILTIAITRYYSQPEFGLFSFALASITIFLPFSRMGLSNIVARLFTKYPFNTSNILTNALKIRIVGAMIGLTACTLYLYLSQSEHLLLVLTCLVFSSFVVFNVCEFYFLANNQILLAIKIKVVTQLIFLLIKIAFVVKQNDIQYILLLHCLEHVFIGCLLYFFASSKIKMAKSVNHKSFAIPLAKKGGWLFLSAAAAVLYLKIDQLMIHQLLGAQQLALYSAATKISELWFIFPVLIANACQPLLVKISNDKKHYQQVLLKIMSLFTLISLIIICLTLILGDTVLSLIFGMDYSSAGSVLSIHVFATLFVFHRAIFSKWLINEKLYKFSLVSHVSGALVNITLNMLLIPLYGIQGAAWASVFAYGTSGLLILFINKKTRVFAYTTVKSYLAWVKIKPSGVLTILKNKEIKGD
ncbi:flippase [Pseudoalteromonas sp. G4]|uniref:flippase n=1 Tax=Pseudoalteromonas sp. G4 TaxID=2992761 RepID=UPI00237D5BBA|nr:flippase [Pseudoalteromonas sp. G4]MDE3271252.1 flippase [Pseudoalteromonas sp. G4]